MTRPLTVLLATSVLSGCFHRVDLAVLEPGDIDLPRNVVTIAVVNRSLPKAGGEMALDISEGLVTGETPRVDSYASAVAIDALQSTLEESGRYKVIEVRSDGRLADTSLWDDPLEKGQVRGICKKAGCDAVVELDSFDTDMGFTVNRKDQGVAVTVLGDPKVTAAWHMWTDQGDPIDTYREVTESTWALDSDSPDADLTAFEGLDDRIAEVAWQAGRAYGERIAPHETMVPRPIYGTGNASMREARRLAKAGDWEGAALLWRQVRERHHHDDLAPKARFNLAVYQEMLGDTDDAYQKALVANRQIQAGRTARYVATLRGRMEDQERLEDQLARRRSEKGVTWKPVTANPSSSQSR